MSARGLLKAAQKKFGLDDAAYRARLERETGKTSSKDMTYKEIQRCLESFKKDGFKPASKGGRRALEGKYAPKLQALWIAGYNLGLIRNKQDRALLAFVKRQTGIDHVRFLHDARDAFRVIEALKGWLERSGGVDWRTDVAGEPYRSLPQYRIVLAQFGKIYGAQPDIQAALWRAFCTEIFTLTRTRTFDDLTCHDWLTVMNLFGKRIREKHHG